jgi:hypothetical protein
MVGHFALQKCTIIKKDLRGQCSRVAAIQLDGFEKSKSPRLIIDLSFGINTNGGVFCFAARGRPGDVGGVAGNLKVEK